MSKFNWTLEHIPNFKEYTISAKKLRDLVLGRFPGITQSFFFDKKYWYVSHEDWGVIIKDVQKGMPGFTTDRFDCDNFASLISARVSAKYKLNTCARVAGGSPYNGHAFNVFLSMVDGEPTLFILEPQDGMVYDTEKNYGYIPMLVMFG